MESIRKSEFNLITQDSSITYVIYEIGGRVIGIEESTTLSRSYGLRVFHANLTTIDASVRFETLVKLVSMQVVFSLDS